MSDSIQADLAVSLTYDNAATAIDWLCETFGFTQRLVVPGPSGTVMHSELSIGSAVIMVSSPKPEMQRVSPLSQTGISQTLCVYTADPDAHYHQAKAAGATIIQEIKDEEYGARGYMAKDLEGHVWYFSTYRPGAHWDNVTHAD